MTQTNAGASNFDPLPRCATLRHGRRANAARDVLDEVRRFRSSRAWGWCPARFSRSGSSEADRGPRRQS